MNGDTTASDDSRTATLEVPGSPGSLATIRVFMARVLAPVLDDDERIEDLKLAVDEICAATDGDRVAVTVVIDRARCVVICEGVAAPADDERGTMRERLLAALVHEVQWSRTERGHGRVRFTMPLE
ncbi:MAG: ATP-binding protein [Actinomycetota bacterium]